MKKHANLIRLTISIFFALCAASATHAAPLCQTLDKSASKLDLTIDIFGSQKKSRIDNIKAFLWVDPEAPENSSISASLTPELSRLFGNFQDNPLLMGMLANVLDNEFLFRSIKITQSSPSGHYDVTGRVSTGNKVYPAEFSINAKEIGRNQSRFSTTVRSRDFEDALGTAGHASGNFDLVFRPLPGALKEDCRL